MAGVLLIAPILLAACGNSSAFVDGVPRGLHTWPSIVLFRVSCPKPGQCVAVGDRQSGSTHQAIVVEQRGGIWSKPIPVSPPLNALGDPLELLSCTGGGNCIAIGGGGPLLLVARNHGRWSGNHVLSVVKAPAALKGQATACSPSGPCWSLAFASAAHPVSFAIGETAGRWLPAVRLGDTASRIRGRRPWAFASDISCFSATSCTVAGEMQSVSKTQAEHPFVQTEVGGQWGPPQSTPSATSTGPGVSFQLFALIGNPGALSCTSKGTCLLGGYEQRQAAYVGAVEQEANGRWKPPVSGIGVAAPSLQSQVYQVSCHSALFCAASGVSELPGNRTALFVQMEVDGRWRRPAFIPTGITWGSFNDVIPKVTICSTASTCDVVGEIVTTDHRYLSFEATYAGSRWHHSVISLGGQHDQTAITGMSCDVIRCWGVGTISKKNGATVAFDFTQVSSANLSGSTLAIPAAAQ